MTLEILIGLKKLLSVVIAFLVLFITIPISFVDAAGVSLTIGTASMAISTAYNSTLSFVPATGLPTSSIVTLYYDTAYTDNSLVNGNVALTKNGDGNYT